METDQLLRTKAVTAKTGIPEATLRYWRHKGIGPRSARLNGIVVYRERDVETWINAQFEASA